MSLRQVLATGAHLFPYKGHGIHPKDIHPHISLKQHIVEHFHEHIRVRIVEIPLVFVEYGHYPTVHFFVESKVARSTFRKNLGHGLLIE